MSGAATLLTDAFNEALSYWAANNVGNRAGLIADLVNVIGVSTATATKWVDAITQETFDLGMSASSSYADFKSWLIAVGAVRGTAGVTVAFRELKEGVLISDSLSEVVGKLDAKIALIDIDITNTNATIVIVNGQAPSTAKTTSLTALNVYLTKLQNKRNVLLVERNREAALVTG